MRRVLLAFVCMFCIALMGCNAAKDQPTSTTQDESSLEIVPKDLDSYTWSDLSRISAEISAAESDEVARSVAQKYGLVDANGALSNQTKMIVLDGSRALDVRIAGIRHDDKADGSGKAGLTFMTVGAVDIRPMNEDDSVIGGWEASDLRAWLESELPKRLEAELEKAVVPVNKFTNNVGLTDTLESITPTADRFWLFSVHEVCGDVTWDSDEYQQKRGYEDLDGLVNAEGSQYEAFAIAGVTGEGGGESIMSLANSSGASPWWYRTPYAFDWQGVETGVNGYFYRVMDSGYPKSMGAPQDPSSVVVGFCV